MRREELFSRSGFYGFLLDSNVLLHREAARAATEAYQPVLEATATGAPVPVLDLACGGWPVTISEVMAAFPTIAFEYTGVDINPDQVALAAGQFPFPDNVVKTRIVEGNAWELDALGLRQACSLIFSGMNLHHGTPEEIWYLGLQIGARLSPGGLFFSHDVYRPDDTPYRRRPAVVGGESTGLVSPERLASAGVPDLGIVRDNGGSDPSWRVDYVQRIYHTLIARGADPAGAESTANHVRSRDYPISTRELRAIMEDLDLQVRVVRYDDSAEPLGPFVATCSLVSPQTVQA